MDCKADLFLSLEIGIIIKPTSGSYLNGCTSNCAAEIPEVIWIPTHLLENNKSIFTIQKLLKHSNITAAGICTYKFLLLYLI